VFFRNCIIFEMFGGVGLESASSALVFLNIFCLWMCRVTQQLINLFRSLILIASRKVALSF